MLRTHEKMAYSEYWKPLHAYSRSASPTASVISSISLSQHALSNESLETEKLLLRMKVGWLEVENEHLKTEIKLQQQQLSITEQRLVMAQDECTSLRDYIHQKITFTRRQPLK